MCGFNALMCEKKNTAFIDSCSFESILLIMENNRDVTYALGNLLHLQNQRLTSKQ